MIEFKQIIGRGTRLFDGKDYFTIYDFVRAHHHFNDPEWDGEPIEPEPPGGGGGGGGKPEPEPPGPGPLPEPPPRPVKLEVKLADGKVRQIQNMTATTFWSADGTPMSAAQFLENLYGVLPEFFKDEDKLRELWSAPDTRRKLLEGLAEKGFSREPLAEMQKAIEAENSDLFDVLAYVAFAAAPETRAQRAAQASAEAHEHFNDRQQAFIDFVLSQYVTQGVDELDADKLTPLLRLKYNNAISDAVADLGGTAQIRTMFTGFQQYLYADPGDERITR
jgi:type I restriction enzyme R subunit